MANKLTTKAQFAQMCGVTAAAVTKALKGRLSAALVRDRIDLAHPTAQEYLRRKTAPRPEEPAPGVDPLFIEALQACRESGRFTASNISRKIKVGYARAQVILSQLEAAGHCEPAQPAGSSGQSKEPKPPSAPRKTRKSAKQLTDWDDGNIEEPDDLGTLANWTLAELLATYGTAVRFHDWLKALKEIEAVNEKRLKNAQQEGKLVSRDLVKAAILDRIDGVFIKLLTDATTTISSRAHAMVKAGEDEKELKKMVEDQLSSFIRPAKEKMREALQDATD